MKTGCQRSKLRLANGPLDEWDRCVHPVEREFCHKSFVEEFGPSLASFGTEKAVKLCAFCLKQHSYRLADLQTCRAMGHGQRIGVGCIRPHGQLR